MRHTGPETPGGVGGRWFAVVAVNLAYMAVTVGEALLAPAFPIAAREFHLDVETAGLAFGLLAAAIAVGNLGGGLLLSRRGPKAGMVAGLALTAGGAVLAAASHARGPFFAGQALLGLGSGAFFASGLSGAGALVHSGRRGLAMGFFGVGFSGGLALAALLVAVGGEDGWRAAFVAAAAFAGVTAAGVIAARIPPLPRPASGSARPRLRRALGIPLLVGGAAAASQYGTVALLPTFAVGTWGLSPAAAAAVLGVARVLSLPGKVATGHAADRTGPMAIARALGLALAVLGAWWTLGPGPGATIWAAVLFAAGVSALAPVANLLALQELSGMLLGAFRSAQIGLGALASAAIGAGSTAIGLRPALAAAAVLIPATLLIVAWPSRRTVEP